MIGIVIPAHNEEMLISECLDSVLLASEHPSLHRQPVKVFVVLNLCSYSKGSVVSAKWEVDRRLLSKTLVGQEPWGLSNHSK